MDNFQFESLKIFEGCNLEDGQGTYEVYGLIWVEKTICEFCKISFFLKLPFIYLFKSDIGLTNQ